MNDPENPKGQPQAGCDGGLAVWRWAVIENIATMICTLLGCWLVSGWFALLMLNINYRGSSRKTANGVMSSGGLARP